MNFDKLYAHPLYREDLERLRCAPFIDWDKLCGSSILLSGGTGQIGSHLVDAVMHMNMTRQLGCEVYLLTRDPEKARRRFSSWSDSPLLHIIRYDIHSSAPDIGVLHPRFVLHLASNTHPRAYATDPIGTIRANVEGTDNMARLAINAGAENFILASSNEIYGENKGSLEFFREEDLGYIDCNTLRAGYPESKRCAEALCHAYRQAERLPFMIARFTRTYGPTLLESDTKAMSQFLGNAVKGEDIVLKSTGDQVYSYTYVTDAVSGLLTLMTKGCESTAYNIAEESFDIPLKDIAKIIADSVGHKVCFGLADETEAKGFSKATHSRLCGERLRNLGWRASYNPSEGIPRTIQIMKDLRS